MRVVWSIVVCATFALMLLFHADYAKADDIVVNTLLDNTSDASRCSLRDAILAANTDQQRGGCDAGSGADAILFDPATANGTIVLQSDLPEITQDLKLIGNGPQNTIIDGSGVSGNDFRALRIIAGGARKSFLLRGFTISNAGNFVASGVIGSGPGGAIIVTGNYDIEIEYLNLLNNFAETRGGAISFSGSPGNQNSSAKISFTNIGRNRTSGFGAGISASGSLDIVISHSSIYQNTAENRGSGGGLHYLSGSAPVDTRISIDHTTVHGNQADGLFGGGLLFRSLNGTADQISIKLTNSTIVDNRAGVSIALGSVADGAGIVVNGQNTTEISLKNTIVANNVFDTNGTSRTLAPQPTIFAPRIISEGNNFFDETAIGFPVGNPNVNGDFVAIGRLELEPFGDHGGPTLTNPPSERLGSLVINRGRCSPARIDQRGFSSEDSRIRISAAGSDTVAANSDKCDIGAVEYMQEGETIERVNFR